MIEGKTVLAVITARGGSKGLPGKNIRPLGGKPLLAWSIEAARASRYVDRCVLSSEDAAIMAVGRAFGCEVPFPRPAHLAADETPGVAPVLHVLWELPERYDLVVLLQPTSPLRLGQDIDGTLVACLAAGAPACVSLAASAESPYHYRALDDRGRLVPLLDDGGRSRRQDLPDTYRVNGAVYVARTDFFQSSQTFFTPETIGYIMPQERSVDIDTELDFAFCEFLLARHSSSVSP